MHDCSILIFVLSYLTYLCIDKLIHIWYQYQQLSSVNFATNIPSSLGDFHDHPSPRHYINEDNLRSLACKGSSNETQQKTQDSWNPAAMGKWRLGAWTCALSHPHIPNDHFKNHVTKRKATCLLQTCKTPHPGAHSCPILKVVRLCLTNMWCLKWIN